MHAQAEGRTYSRIEVQKKKSRPWSEHRIVRENKKFERTKLTGEHFCWIICLFAAAATTAALTAAVVAAHSQISFYVLPHNNMELAIGFIIIFILLSFSPFSFDAFSPCTFDALNSLSLSLSLCVSFQISIKYSYSMSKSMIVCIIYAYMIIVLVLFSWRIINACC